MYLGKCVAIVMHFLNKDQRIEEETKNFSDNQKLEE